RTDDGLVADDYYRQGLDINRVLEREERARALGVAAAVQFREDRQHVRVILRSGGEPPRALRLTIVHPTREGDDQVIALAQSSPGVYDGAMGVPRAARHGLRLEDDAGEWRIAGTWPREASSVNLGTNP
ncbi:MAG TPA: FixH family protein, partial [Usitatibacter sp.]